MNKVILMGRFVREPDIRNSQGQKSCVIARFTLAIPRKYKNNGQEEADYVSCIAFGKTAEFIEKYLTKGSKVVLSGRVQSGSYTNKEGKKIYLVEVVTEEIEFAERKMVSSEKQGSTKEVGDGFMNIPDDEEDMPFS